MFLIPNAIILYMRRKQVTKTMVLVMSLLTIWATRLSYHIHERYKGEDWRYQEIKDGW